MVKKVVTILIVFALMVGAMIGEIVYVNKFYNSVQADLQVIAERLEQKWEKGKKFLLTLQNHNTVRNFDDKIVSLSAVVKSDNYNDAVIFVRSAINYIDDVLLDSIPYITNNFVFYG